MTDATTYTETEIFELHDNWDLAASWLEDQARILTGTNTIFYFKALEKPTRDETRVEFSTYLANAKVQSFALKELLEATPEKTAARIEAEKAAAAQTFLESAEALRNNTVKRETDQLRQLAEKYPAVFLELIPVVGADMAQTAATV